jgi:murein L,D-transpeptidase YafK
MDQDTKSAIDQILREITGMITSMEKRLEEKIDTFIMQSRDSHREIDTRHKDFQADIKQMYGRIELQEKNLIQVESRVKSLEDEKVTGRWRWEVFIAVGGLLLAAAAMVYGGV